ncbi:MAG: tRNA (adenosine(37)-N6)-threonylcarbamoyltransferase complex dimerization subunit type 1 TsaB [Micrococcales bacterium]
MSVILAIDTSAGTSVALLRDGALLAELNSDNHLKHAETIGEAIASVLAEAGVVGVDVDRVIVGRGPAPFTGLRVGLAAAIMFAEGAKAKLAGVVSLDAIALRAFEAGVVASPERPLLVNTDARRGERYFALYSGLEAGIPVRVQGPAVAKPEALAELLASQGLEPIETHEHLTAKALAQVAIAQDLKGQLDSDASALYLRAPDAVEPKAPGQFGKKVSS